MKHQKNSKSTKILKHLINGNTIDSIEAFNDFNTTRLSSVIKCLRNNGYYIETFYKPYSRLGNYRMILLNGFDINKKLFNNKLFDNKIEGA
tara:strand:+ start:71 stop:343 length:273 start_codon:yes stop_codon:yes gene_type:complete